MSTSPAILIVDDEPAGRQALEALLDEQGYTLILVEDGPMALEQASNTVPDLILLDVMMPGMDGFEVCQRLRQDPILAEVPIILVTALDDQQSRVQGIEAGADDFISKPFHRSELRARVRTVTRLNRYRRLLNERLKFEWMAEQSVDGYILVDVADEILYANSRARIYLLSDDNLDPAGMTFLSLVQERYRCEPEISWADWPVQSEERSSQTRYLVRPESTSVRALWLSVDIFEQPEITGETRLLCLRDVTQKVTTWRDMRTFHTALSHKLLTPLNILVGGLEIVAGGELGPDYEIIEMVELAYQGGRQLQESIEDILNYMKGDSLVQIGGYFPFVEYPGLVQRASASLQLDNVSVIVDQDVRHASTSISEQSLEWMLWELLDNAKKFHPNQTPMVQISVAAAEKGWVRLTIVDDGVSLCPEHLENVWIPYYQGEKYFTGEMAGMGLGLPTVASMIWHVGGSWTLYNRTPGPGVVVELTLPLLS